MADLSDVEDALCGLIETILYPQGTKSASVTGATIKIYRGWPNSVALNTDLVAGTQTVTVFSDPHKTKDTSRYPRVWRPATRVVPTLTVSVQNNVVTFGGTGAAGQTAGISVNGQAYSVAVAAADTPDSVAAAFGSRISGASVSGSSVTLTSGSRIVARVVGSGSAIMETRRQEQGVVVSVWCPTPLGRDAVSTAIDQAFSGFDWFDLSDGMSGRLVYRGTEEIDTSENASLYRRNLEYGVEYPTTQTMSSSEMLFGIGTLSGGGQQVGFSALAEPAAISLPALGAIRFDAWYDPANSIDQQCAAALSPDQFHSRLPSNAVISGNGATWPLATQATMDAEIAAAVQAGLSFWAFDSYQPTDTLSLALQLYLSSSLKNQLRFCMLGQVSNWGSDGQDQPSLLRDITMMTQPGYMTVLDGRPLYFVLDGSAAQTAGLPAGGVAAAVTLVREQVQAAGGGNPYIVWLSGAALADYDNTAAAEAVGADCAGAYATPRLNGGEQAYNALATAASADWTARAAGSFPMVPTAMSGWDQRPLVTTPQPFYPISSGFTVNNFYDAPTPDELAAHVADMARFVLSNAADCPAQVGLIYAWNELAEGGWLMPTYGVDGPQAERPVAVGAALKALAAAGITQALTFIN